jgi:integrase
MSFQYKGGGPVRSLKFGGPVHRLDDPRVAQSPEGFTFHDLRHYLASLLIASGADIKTVQARMRHATARTTLDTHGHLWPDADESTRTAVGAVIKERMKTTADALRTETT